MRALLLIGSLLLLLNGCITAQADEVAEGTYNAPEDAVFTWMGAQPSQVANSTAIVQVGTLDESHAPLLVLFEPEGWQGERPALALFHVERRAGRWEVAGMSHAASPPASPLSVWGPPPEAGFPFAAALGLADDPTITQISVIWGDGLEQGVPVVRGSWLALRPAGAPTTGLVAEAYNAQGVQVARATFP